MLLLITHVSILYKLFLETPQRVYNVDDEDDELIGGFDGDHICTKVLPNIESFDLINGSTSNYAREDCEGIWIDHTSKQ